MPRVVGERRRIAAPHEFAALQGGHHKRRVCALVGQLCGVRRQSRRAQDVALGRAGRIGFHHDVVDVGPDRDSHVGGQRPGRRGPDQDERAGQLVGACEAIAHRQRGVLAVLINVVVHPQLVVGQRGLVVPAVGQDPETLIDQTLLKELLEGPDHALHVVRIECAVVVFKVNPARLPGDVLLPVGGVLQHRLAALLVEGADAQLEDFVLGLDAQLAHRLELGRQAVRVPAESPFDAAPTHGLIARHHVLDVTGQQVPIVRESVREGRAVVEHELVGAVLTCVPLLDTGGERVIAVPIGQHGFFDRREGRRRGHRGGLGMGDLGIGHRLLLRFVFVANHEDDVRRRTCAAVPPRLPPVAGRPLIAGLSRAYPSGSNEAPVGGPFFRRLAADNGSNACAPRVRPQPRTRQSDNSRRGTSLVNATCR